MVGNIRSLYNNLQHRSVTLDLPLWTQAWFTEGFQTFSPLKRCEVRGTILSLHVSHLHFEGAYVDFFTAHILA
jgi:hypothetical protein